MKKIYVLTVVALLLCISTFSLAAPVKVTLWHSMGGDIGKAMESLISEYNAEQSEVVVEPVFRGTYPEVLNAAVASARAGTAPTCVQIYEVGSRAAIDSGVFMPLDELLGPTDVDWDDYVDAVINYYRVGGRQWSRSEERRVGKE